jgi:glutamate---cysteine ligase / carboxylate-amine ligase
MLTFGVEEEYLLLDLDTGLPVPRSAQVRAAADRMASVAEREVEPELLQAQVEVGTPICGSLREVTEQLTRLRAAVATAAARSGCRVAACGAAPVRAAAPVPVTAKARYRTMSEDAPQLVDEQLINGMHVHVGIPDRDSGVGALNRIRPWLPVLVALGANSPLWDGGDTGFASWRTLVFDRWPVSGPPPAFADAADYSARTQALHDAGAILDRGQLYWQARLSERYPTIEIRALDVQLEIQDAVTLAGVVRALVADALQEHQRAVPLPEAPGELIAAATWQAARHGLDGNLVDPLTALPCTAREAVETLLKRITPALQASGDLEPVASGIERLLTRGNGAQRQRRAFERGGLDAVLELVTTTAEPQVQGVFE